MLVQESRSLRSLRGEALQEGSELDDRGWRMYFDRKSERYSGTQPRLCGAGRTGRWTQGSRVDRRDHCAYYDTRVRDICL